MSAENACALAKEPRQHNLLIRSLPVFHFYHLGHLLVVLELAENGSLLEFLKKSREVNQNFENINSGGITEELKLRIATDVAKGMSHLASFKVSSACCYFFFFFLLFHCGYILRRHRRCLHLSHHLHN